MKTLGIAAGAVINLLTIGSSFAADLPMRNAPAVFVPPTPIFTWTGAYIGGNVGAAFDAGQSSRIAGQGNLQANIADGLRPGYGSLRNAGFSGGGQVGYNYQLGSVPLPGSLGGGGAGGGIVIGLEADAAYTDLHASASYLSDRLSSFASRTDFVGTVRGRLGYAFGNVLVYGTGGFAYGNVRSDTQFYGPLGNLTYQGDANRIRTGYAYGGGIEYAIPTTSFLNVLKANAVTVKVEFIRYDLGRYNLALPNVNGQIFGYNQNIHAYGDIARVGINYKFGSPASVPIVARY